MALPQNERVTDSTRVFRIRLAPDDGRVPSYKPGQFVFISFPHKYITSFPRPFSLSSPPSEGRFIELLAKDADDWRGRARTLPPLTSTLLWGPFGRSDYLESSATRRFVFLAGGIGASPFLSAIRFMAHAERNLRILFIWGARTRDDLVGKEALSPAAASFGFVPVLSHDPRWTGERGRIDGEKLGRLVPAFFGTSPEAFEWNSASYRLCGPGTFSRDLRRVLRGFGVDKRAIRSQSFFL